MSQASAQRQSEDILLRPASGHGRQTLRDITDKALLTESSEGEGRVQFAYRGPRLCLGCRAPWGWNTALSEMGSTGYVKC